MELEDLLGDTEETQKVSPVASGEKKGTAPVLQKKSRGRRRGPSVYKMNKKKEERKPDTGMPASVQGGLSVRPVLQS